MSACVYQCEEELWEDLLWFALTQAQRHRRVLERQVPGMLPASHQPYRSAVALARSHLADLRHRAWPVSPILVEMARAEGVA